MRVFLPATLAAFVAAGATFAFAQSPAPQGPGSDPRMERRMERRGERMQERFVQRMSKLKTELKLTLAQEPLFASVEQQFRKMADERRAARQGTRDNMRNAELPDRLDFMAQRAARNASAMSELSGTVKPLWATMTAEQKEIVKKNLPGRGRWGGEGRKG
jgi:hypothetical protein